MFAEDALAAGEKRAVSAEGWPLLVARTPEGYRAVLNRCSHVAAALDGGRFRRGQIQCPKHGALFDLSDGRCIGGAYQPLRTFSINVESGNVVVEVPDEAPSAEDMPVLGI